MQQYFYDVKLKLNDIIPLGKDTLYHIKKVLRKGNDYIFRIADKSRKIYKCKLVDDNAQVIEELDENNELDVNITAILALFKNDKYELCIQKLVELGVNRIVPFEAERSVVKGSSNKRERLCKIAREAAEQSHRNIIPEITDTIKLKDLDKYMSENNYIAYESENVLNSQFNVGSSISYIIGPEGGFSDIEYEKIKELGFNSISLGKRILRAETAAIYMTSVIVSKIQ